MWGVCAREAGLGGRDGCEGPCFVAKFLKSVCEQRDVVKISSGTPVVGLQPQLRALKEFFRILF